MHKTLTYFRPPSDEKIADMVWQLLEQGADPNIRRHDNTTVLHRVLYHGSVEVGRLLLSYGAKVDEKDESGRTPFQIASSRGKDEMTKCQVMSANVFQHYMKLLKRNKYVGILSIAVTTLQYIMISMITIFSMYIAHVR